MYCMTFFFKAYTHLTVFLFCFHQHNDNGSILHVCQNRYLYFFINSDWLFTVLRPAQEFFTYMETLQLPVKGLPNLGLCSALRAFEQGGIFIVTPAVTGPRFHPKYRPIQSRFTTHKRMMAICDQCIFVEDHFLWYAPNIRQRILTHFYTKLLHCLRRAGFFIIINKGEPLLHKVTCFRYTSNATISFSYISPGYLLR
jgi:hypothetical protein